MHVTHWFLSSLVKVVAASSVAALAAACLELLPAQVHLNYNECKLRI